MKSRLSPPDLLCFAIYSANHKLHRIYRDLLDPFGVTYAQYLVILALADADEIIVKSLGELLGLDSGTLTPLLKRLETSGKVTRRRNPDDERQTLVGLTEQGRQLHGKLSHVPSAVLSATGLSADQAADLREQLHQI